MAIDRLKIGVWVGLALFAACDKKPAAPAATKAATVTAPVKEAELTTVKLTADAEKRLGIKTVTVEKRAVPRTRNVGGEVVAPSGTSLAITAPTSGVLQAPNGMPVAGTSVTKGQLLFRLVPLVASERDSPVVAQQAIDTATAKRDAAAQKAQRADQLLKDGAGSRRQLEEAQAELAVAEAELKAARDRRALAARSGTTEAGVRLEAPQNGVIQAVHVREGQTVSSAAPLLDLVQLAAVWVRVPIYAGESKDIDPKAPAHSRWVTRPKRTARFRRRSPRLLTEPEHVGRGPVRHVQLGPALSSGRARVGSTDATQ